jgi:tetratricopeptide (TPR) repeat protein
VEKGRTDEREAALRPLKTLEGVLASLRAGSLPPEDTRAAVIQVASAIDMSLRRVLRDHPAVPIETRLKALAPDELRVDEVLAELRRHDRISMELGAAVHDLLEARRRLKQGAPAMAGDASLAFGVAERLEYEITQPPASRSAAASTPEAHPARRTAPAAEDHTVIYPLDVPMGDDPTPPRGAGVRREWVLALVALLLVLVPAAFFLLRSGGGDEGMQQGIALFRIGQYEDAASHFYRYAQANPNDATPHLYLARIHRRLERYDLAVPELQRAFDLAPNDPDVHTELGLLLTDRRRYDEAIPRLREAIRLDRESEAAWVGLIRALRESGQAAAAEAELAQAPPAVRAMLARPTP